MVSYPVQNYKARILNFQETLKKWYWQRLTIFVSMYFFIKKGNKKHSQKALLTLMVFALLSFQIPQVSAGSEPYSVPKNWPNEWVTPFADEQLVVAVVPKIERKVRLTKKVTATAYSSDVHQTDSTPFGPAMAMDFREVVAKDGFVNCIAHNDLRLGTEVRFPDMFGDAVYTVCDRMNARYTGTGRIDFYFYVIGEDGKIDSKESLNAARANAKAFGIKRGVKMEILMPV